MRKWANGLIVGATVLAAAVAKVSLKAIPAAIGYFAGKSAVEFFHTPGLEREIRAGFSDVSSDWDQWLALWRDSSETAFRLGGARAVVEHVTEEELLEIFRTREGIYARIATDSTLNDACLNGYLGAPVRGLDDAEFRRVARIVGRALARQHMGAPAWRPPVNLEEDRAAWASFADYVTTHAGPGVLHTLVAAAEPGAVTEEEACLALSRLFGMAAARPDDPVGGVGLADFVRAMEALALP